MSRKADITGRGAQNVRMSCGGAVVFLLLVGALCLLPAPAGAEGELKIQVPELCYQCHGQTKQSLSKAHVHAPFRQGKCISCHNSHATKNKGLLHEAANQQCLGCHESIGALMKKASVHGALKKGACTDCHHPHASSNRALLVTEERNVCWKCHEPLREKLKNTVVHAPFRDGKCSSCHNPHASAQDYQLLSDSNRMCKTCHAPGCRAGGVSIAGTTKDMDCVGCHSGHSAGSKGLLGPFGHSAFLNRQCDQCHGSPSAAAMPTKAAGKDLCFLCHKKDPAKFREGDIHGSDKSGCGACHQPHGSVKKNLTVNETAYCTTCHQTTAKRIAAMAKSFAPLRCVPIRNLQCFECHVPLHSQQPRYLRGSMMEVCTRCHSTQHRVSHPMGAGVIDPRDGQQMHCMSCHSMHSAKAEYMLIADRKRQLCIQCHKRQ